MKVLRNNKTFSKEELDALASILRRIFRDNHRLFSFLGGRALARWIDPLCTPSGSAMKYFEKLRSALDDEEAMGVGSDKARFYGWKTHCETEKCWSREATWLIWTERAGLCENLRVLCHDCQVKSGATRHRELRHFDTMHTAEFFAWLNEYKWSQEDCIKIFRLWSEGV